MQEMNQMMGYDRAITMFSPDGRLLQVEYAKKTVKQGSTAIGLKCKDGVLLVTDKRIFDELVMPESIEKIFKIDDHIAATASGIISDARILIERSQLKAQQHRVSYDSPVDVITVVKEMCDLKQICTQSAGLRPFGVSILVAGIDLDGPKLYKTDPAGIYFGYKAVVIGEGETEVEKILHKEYKENLNIDAALELSIRALTKALGEDFNTQRIDAAVISSEDNKFKVISNEKIEGIFKKIKGKK